MRTLFVVLVAALAALSAADPLGNFLVMNQNGTYDKTGALVLAVNNSVPTIYNSTFDNVSFPVDIKDLTADNVTVVHNVTITSFYIKQLPSNFSLNATNSSIIVGYNATFVLNVTFNLTNTNHSIRGYGSAAVESNATNFSVYIGRTPGYLPSIVCTNLTINFTNVTNVTTNLTGLNATLVNPNVTAALNLTLPNITNVTKNNVTAALQAIYNSQNSGYQQYVTYDNDLSNTLTWNNSYDAVIYKNLSLLEVINGGINDAKYNAPVSVNTANFANQKPKQAAFAKATFQSFLQYSFDKSWVSVTLNHQTTPLSTFDFTVLDLTNVVPQVYNSALLTQFVSVVCTPNAVTTVVFDVSAQSIDASINFNCGFYLPSSSTPLFNVTTSGVLNLLPTVTDSGNVNFFINSAQYTAKSAALVGVPAVTGFQYTLLEYYVSQAIADLPTVIDLILTGGYQLPWTNLSDYDVLFDSNWLYISAF